MTLFVQLAATRDGLDPYLRAARIRGMEAVLIETPEYIQWRKVLERQEFDHTIAVEQPSNPEEVIEAIKQLHEPPTLILAGFDRYVYSAYQVARRLRIRPYFVGDAFVPPNKAEQRAIIAKAATSILQPRYCALTDHQTIRQDLADFCYPVVVKPIDGGGGLGVFLATTFDEVEAALIELQTVTNYDGAQFRGICIEEYIPGTEYSVQGLVHGGYSTILTFCKKWIGVEPVKSRLPLRRFREVCHIAVRGDRADAEVKHLTQACVDMFGYQNGPFHIDMVKAAHGYYHLEMGFRLSGAGLVRLVERVSGYDWAEEAFALHLGKSSLQGARESESPCIAQLTAVLPTEIQNARLLQQQGPAAVEIQSFNVPLERATSQRLKSDLIRHTGVVGRIAIAARTIEEVEGLLRSCSPNLAEKPVFV